MERLVQDGFDNLMNHMSKRVRVILVVIGVVGAIALVALTGKTQVRESTSTAAGQTAKRQYTADQRAEISDMIATFLSTGLVTKIDAEKREFQVDELMWAMAPYDTKKNVTWVCSRWRDQNNGYFIVRLVGNQSGRTLSSVGVMGGVDIAGAD